MVVLLLVIARRARTSSGDFSALCSEGDMRDPDTAGTLQGRHGHFFRSPAAHLCIFAQQEFTGKEHGFDLRSLLANIRPLVMETVSVLPFGKLRENWKT